MDYIILAAGVGSRLHPYTKTFPKSLIKVGNGITAIKRTVSMIKELDKNARVVLVLGYMKNDIIKELEGLNVDEVVFNPFYKITNSIASLWFAKDIIKGDAIIMNGDVVLEQRLFLQLIADEGESFVVYDSSMRTDIDYAVQLTNDGHISVMGKNLKKNNGEYVGIIKLSKDSIDKLMEEIGNIIEENNDTWYETALVQMILTKDFRIKGRDISMYSWTELDSIDDVFLAREICAKDSK